MLTDFGAQSELRKRLWSAKVTKQNRDDNFFMSNGFMGADTEDSTRPIHRVTDLTRTERGIECVMPLVADLTGGGVVGDNELEGNEEALVTDQQVIRIDQLRNGVRNKGRMSEQATVIRFRVQAKDALAFWLADIIDELMFLTAAGRAYSLNTDGSTRAVSQLPQLAFAADVAAPTNARIMYAGTATSEATLTANDILTWDLVTRVKAYAKRKRITPVRAGGRMYYILVTSTEACRDLEQSADYKSIQAQAMPRGTSNPLFMNAKKIINDIVVYDHPKVFNTLGLASGSKWGAGGTVDGAQCFLMGAQALGFASLDDGMPGWEESAVNDYNNRPAIAIGRIIGMLKPRYKARHDSQTVQDKAMVAMKVAAAAS
jgi:N4-gp56 family major capsid protein